MTIGTARFAAIAVCSAPPASSDEYVRLRLHQLGRSYRQATWIIDVFVIDADIESFAKGLRTKLIAKGLKADRGYGPISNVRTENADAINRTGLLRACGERPGSNRAAERGYELTPANVDCHLPLPKLG